MKRSQFSRNLQTEILRLLNEQHPHITREEVEEIGRRSGMLPEEAGQEFLRLRGQVWAGTTRRSRDSEYSWDIAHLDVYWFQRRE